MSKKLELQRELVGIVESMRAISAKDQITAEDSATLQKLEERSRSIETAISAEDRAKHLEGFLNQHAGGQFGAYSQFSGDATEQERSVKRLEILRSYLLGERSERLTDEERSLFADRAQVTTNPGTGTAGGILVPTELVRAIEVMQKAYGGIISVAKVWTTSSGNPIDYPTLDYTANEGSLIAENANLADGTDLTFGKKTFNSYKYNSGVIYATYEMLRDSAVDIASYMAEMITIMVDRKVAKVLATGTGSSQPEGFVTGATAVTGISGATASGITFDALIDLQHSVNAAYRGNAQFAFNDNTLSVLRKIKDSYGRYIWQPADARTGEPATILGHPYVIDHGMANIGASAKSVAFGDFSKFMVRQIAGANRLKRSDVAENAFTTDSTAFIYYTSLDSKVINNGAIKVLQHASS